MGKWAQRLAERLAQTASAAKHGTVETDRTPVLSVLSGPQRGVVPEIPPRAPSPAPARPFKLSPVDAEVAHADPWSERQIVQFQARAQRVRRFGFSEQDAEDLSEQMHLRDVHADYRAPCVECEHFRPWRCGNARAAGLNVAALPRDLAVLFQHCAGFAPAAETQ